MRISDWSSDVCSSDLNPEFPIPARPMPSILLVEDETAIADTVLYALRAEGFEARHCLTGKEALRAAGERVHDLAILDVGLPDIGRSEEHTSELQSLMRSPYAVLGWKNKKEHEK